MKLSVVSCLISDSGKVSAAGPRDLPIPPSKASGLLSHVTFTENATSRWWGCRFESLTLGREWNGALPDSGRAVEEDVNVRDERA